MKIEVRSKLAAAEFVCDVPWIAISIVSDVCHWPKLSEDNRLGLLQLAFHDRSDPLYLNHPLTGLLYFQPQQALHIWDFINKYGEDAECLLVHCEAGVSRSAAVAAAIALVQRGRGGDEEFFTSRSRFVPNMHVYRTMLNLYMELPQGKRSDFSSDLSKEPPPLGE